MNDTEPARIASKSAPVGDDQDFQRDQQDSESEGQERSDREAHGDGDPSTRGNRDQEQPREIGGRKGPDPVRYGDWEKNGRCIDF